MSGTHEIPHPAAVEHAVARRELGRGGPWISEIAFGAGPVSGLMTPAVATGSQRDTISKALEYGINWFDTAAGYGGGQSEENLGRALAELGATDEAHVATKVRLAEEDLGNITRAVKTSVAGSLRRLRRERVTLLQLHNAITAKRGEAPTSITPDDVLGCGGVLEAFEQLRAEGLVEHLGLTGMGDLASLREVMQAGPWLTMQVNHHALLRRMGDEEDLLEVCGRAGIAVLAIRVMAGGALAGQMPSAHTLKTPFYPLAIYERDLANARCLAEILPPEMTLPELAVRHVLGDPRVASAIIGFASARQVEEAVQYARAGGLPEALRSALNAIPLPVEKP
jgi:aryl-alcohol dehydrogenase-like predicted oxidoreductase